MGRHCHTWSVSLACVFHLHIHPSEDSDTVLLVYCSAGSGTYKTVLNYFPSYSPG